MLDCGCAAKRAATSVGITMSAADFDSLVAVLFRFAMGSDYAYGYSRL